MCDHSSSRTILPWQRIWIQSRNGKHDQGWEASSTKGVMHKHTHTLIHHTALSVVISFTRIFLGCWTKPENSKKTHKNMWRTCDTTLTHTDSNTSFQNWKINTPFINVIFISISIWFQTYLARVEENKWRGLFVKNDCYGLEMISNA